MKTAFTFIFLMLFCQSVCAQLNQKNRVVILTDIEADPDDTQSMVRLLLYSNVIDIKGLIATTSVWKKTSVAPESIINPDVAWGMEGDTPAFLSLIPNGLNEPEHPEWGGWSGRYELYKPDFTTLKKGSSGFPHEPETRKIWANAIDDYTPYIHKEYGRAVGKDSVSFADNKVTLWRWRDDFQNDFAARMDWCIKSYQEANHPPVPVLGNSEEITVKSGEGFGLDASGSTDPDGDNLSYLWFDYPEAGSYKKEIKISGAENAHGAYIIAPEVEKKRNCAFYFESYRQREASIIKI